MTEPRIAVIGTGAAGLGVLFMLLEPMRRVSLLGTFQGTPPNRVLIAAYRREPITQ